MNLTRFLKQTDALTAQYTTAQLIEFIHDTARTLPERCREDFLKRLKAVGEVAQEPAESAFEEIELDERCRYIRSNLKRIASQEIRITAVLNEEYDDWYNDPDEEFYYEDNDGISDILEDAFGFIHTCMDIENYQEGFEIGKQVLSIEIMCDNEYGEEEFSLEDMVYHELIYCELQQVVLDAAYCAYHAVSPEKRPETLYEIMGGIGKGKVTLEALMQHGDEGLLDFDRFLQDWIAYLGGRTEEKADGLIGEAVDLLNDASYAVQYAETYAEVHPRLFLKILENKGCADAGKMVSIGMKAMDRIPANYMIRSRVALKTAEYVIEADEDEALLKKCCFAAYESDTTAMNYLRVLLNGYHSEENREKLRSVFKRFYANPNKEGLYFQEYSSDKQLLFERKENSPVLNQVLALRFLDGQFEYVLNQGLNQESALGWTGTFTKQGIALFLLYLHSGLWNGSGIAAMAARVKETLDFSASEYRKGVCGSEETGENEVFYQVFSEWKKLTPMSPEIREATVKRITRLLEKRTEGIMAANRRNYYGECAAYIAALGEVMESMGEPLAKQRLMTSYKNQYFRRSAFRKELKHYGWIG